MTIEQTVQYELDQLKDKQPKHTPGPWHVVNGGKNLLIYIDSETSNVCDLYHKANDGNIFLKPNALANAKLIAKAPEQQATIDNLIIKLQGAIEALELFTDAYPKILELNTMLRMAILKATQ